MEKQLKISLAVLMLLEVFSLYASFMLLLVLGIAKAGIFEMADVSPFMLNYSLSIVVIMLLLNSLVLIGAIAIFCKKKWGSRLLTTVIILEIAFTIFNYVFLSNLEQLQLQAKDIVKIAATFIFYIYILYLLNHKSKK